MGAAHTHAASLSGHWERCALSSRASPGCTYQRHAILRCIAAVQICVGNPPKQAVLVGAGAWPGPALAAEIDHAIWWHAITIIIFLSTPHALILDRCQTSGLGAYIRCRHPVCLIGTTVSCKPIDTSAHRLVSSSRFELPSGAALTTADIRLWA